jgi:hypothetical protein
MIQLRIGISIPTVDGFHTIPIILTPKEYEISLKESMRNYFKKKSDATGRKKKVEAKKIYCPNITSIQAFESISANTIDVKPGYDLWKWIWGARYTKQDNPTFFLS